MRENRLTTELCPISIDTFFHRYAEDLGRILP